ncbi:1-aminocyclopropane-1-carboxylate oxidase-like [Typha angustifolia]|uniref:1-aminocyclopropane-1-carboxylate oxidase-like n=1 Tax=Typha angustifolia TaxID=59011 RepID=UPI003C305951
MAIPVIDFSNLEGKERAETLAQIANGCQEWGFFQLVNHGISVELLERVKKVCSECYKLREESFKQSNPVKLLNKLVEEEGEGVGVQKLDDLDWEDVFTLQDDNQWPSQPPEFKETMMQFRKEIKNLAEKITEIMDINLGLEPGYIRKAFSSSGNYEPFFGTKVSHYPPCPRPDLVNGLRAHTDAGGVILLFQDDQVSGLQILKDGHWIDVQPVSNSIVINIGDQIEVVSNGRYKSVWHRVIATPGGNRQSIASFYNPSLKAIIAPATIKEEEEGFNSSIITSTALYPTFVFGDYMDVYVKKKFQAKEPRFEAAAASM